jgi:biopolymer transport protein ExbD
MARRKRVSSAGASDEEEINLTPMLDVVFILLIFFIVTAQFIKEPGVDVNRVEVVNLTEQKPLAILVAIDENSDVYIDKKVVKPNELTFTLRELRNDNPKGELIVQVDQESNARALVELMEVIAEVDGLAPVHISTLEK